MLKNIKSGLFLFLLLMEGTIHAASGLFFDVSSSGTPANILVSLCLNGKGPVSCQNYTLTGLDVSIKSQVPTHPGPYPIAGMKILTPGFVLQNDCIPWPTGYCLFQTSNTEVKTFTIQEEGNFTVGGTISGLHQSGLILQNNGTDDLPVASNATQFTFPTAISGPYNVTILQNPTGQQCTVMNGSGTVNGDITDVSVICSDLSYTISGTISGLTLSGLVIQNNGADNLNIPANATTFTFPIKVAYGSGYNVQVVTMPGAGALSCIVYNGTGFNVTADVNNVSIICNPPYAYIANPNYPGISVCALNPDGTLGTCSGTPQNPGSTFASPTDIAVNIQRTAAYITNNSNGSLSTCALNASGNLTSCQATSTGQFSSPFDITMNTSTTTPMLYVGESNVGISQCSITGTTVNLPCTRYSPGNIARGFALNGNNTKIYITGTTGLAITSCDVGTDGLIVGASCQQFNTSFPPFNIAVNRQGTRAYVTDPIQSKVYICTINAITGVVTGCTDAGVSSGSTNYIAINSTETTTYLTNFGTNTVYTCPIVIVNNVATLGTCTGTVSSQAPQGMTVTN